jgi:3-oxoacyl-[acyl-carrier-protein] synthase II
MSIEGTAAYSGSGRRVVVTGFGVISSVGTGRAAFLSGLREGRCGVSPITRLDTRGFPHARAYEVLDFEPANFLQQVKPEECGRVSAQAAAAARMAVDDAGLDLGGLRAERGLIAVGTSAGESIDVDDLAAAQIAGGLESLPETLVRRLMPGRLSTTVAMELGLSNVEAVTIPTVCAAGNYAVGYGLDAIRLGEAEYALCGGADAVSRVAFAGFSRLRAWAPEQVRPFDRDREGFMFGDGAAILVLESLEHARRRGATVLAEVTGLHLNCDAEHPTKPSAERVAQCLAGALRDASADPGDVDLVFAHGSGTRINDPTEVTAMRQVFGATPPPVTAIKAMIGHTAGAAGAHACIAAVLGILHDFIPPTINFATPDPDCLIDCVPNVAREARLGTVVVNSLGVGGQNSSVVIRRAEYV